MSINEKCDPKQFELSKKCLEFIQLDDDNNNNKIKHDCYKCLMNNDYNAIKIIYFHTVWEITSDEDNNEFRVLNLNLMSFLATQNLCCSRLILWKLRNFSNKKEQILKSKYKEYYDKEYFQIRAFLIILAMN